MMKACWWVILWSVTALRWVCGADSGRLEGSWGELHGEPLVPAVLGMWTDQTGAAWNLQDHATLGRIGSGMMNAGEQLWIDGVSFGCDEPLMTRSSGEWVFPGNRLFSGLAVSRRVVLNRERGLIRYAEILHNPSAGAVSAMIELRTQYNGNIGEVRSGQGRISPSELTGEETGIVITPAPSNRDRLLVYGLGGPDSLARPAISNPSRFALHVRYSVTVPAGGIAILIHAQAQPIPGDGLRQLDLEELAAGLPKTERAAIVNLASPQAREPRARLLASIRQGWGESPAADTLIFEPGSRLSGTLSAPAKLGLKTAWGSFGWPLDEVAALEVTGQVTLLHLRSGECWRGTLQAPGLSFVPSAGGGAAIALDQARPFRCVRSGVPVPTALPAEASGWVETHEGERFALTNLKQTPAGFTSPWGAWSGDLDGIAAFAWDDGEAWLTRRDGTHVRAFPIEDSWALTLVGGAKIVLPLGKIRRIVHRDGAGLTGGISARLKEGETLVGEWGLDLCEVAPAQLRTAAIRKLTRIDAGVRIELWDGGTIQGPLAGGVIPLVSSGQEFRIGLTDLIEVTSRGPTLNPEDRARIQTQIAQLGSPIWAERDKASAELRRVGAQARAELEEALRSSTEPETVHRLHQLLKEL